jgi:hypothetical protein
MVKFRRHFGWFDNKENEMKESEFKKLELGDKVRLGADYLEVTYVDKDFDFSVDPPERFTWMVEFDNGTNSRLGDNLSRLGLMQDEEDYLAAQEEDFDELAEEEWLEQRAADGPHGRIE